MGPRKHLLLVWLALWPLLGLGEPASDGPHSLAYHYVGTYDASGLLEFGAAGLLDGAPIDGYDRAARAKVPAQPWVGDGLDPEYWRQGSVSRAAKEDWFRRNVEILKQRTNQTQAAPQLQAWSCPTPSRPGWLTLECLAWGFPTRDIEVSWLRGNATLPGAEAGAGLPSGDGSYQRRSRLPVPEGQAQGVQCQASHGDLEMPLETPLETTWAGWSLGESKLGLVSEEELPEDS